MAKRRKLSEYHSSQLGILYETRFLLNNATLHDIEFHVNRSSYFAHSAVLALHSPHFARKLQSCELPPGMTFIFSGRNEESLWTIAVHDCREEVFNEFLYFLYYGRLKSSPRSTAARMQTISELYVLAGACEVPGLLARINERYAAVVSAMKNKPQAPELSFKEIIVQNLRSCALRDRTFELRVSNPGQESSIKALSPVLMCCRSSYFRSLLSGLWSDCAENSAVVHDVPADVLSVITSFIHFEDLDIASASIAALTDLLSWSLYFGVHSLNDLCISLLKQRVSVDNVSLVWNIAAHHSETEALAKKCKEIFLDNFLLCCSKESFNCLHAELLREMLVPGEVEADSREMIQAVQRWAKAQHPGDACKERAAFLQLMPPNTMFNVYHRLMILGRLPVGGFSMRAVFQHYSA